MTPAALPLVLFGATYLLLAIGRIPGLALDRTGFAVLGALAFLATRGISIEEVIPFSDPGQEALVLASARTTRLRPFRFAW
jgi:hypothetical protein